MKNVSISHNCFIPLTFIKIEIEYGEASLQFLLKYPLTSGCSDWLDWDSHRGYYSPGWGGGGY